MLLVDVDDALNVTRSSHLLWSEHADDGCRGIHAAALRHRLQQLLQLRRALGAREVHDEIRSPGAVLANGRSVTDDLDLPARTGPRQRHERSSASSDGAVEQRERLESAIR